jgi:hypothetical protein
LRLLAKGQIIFYLSNPVTNNLFLSYLYPYKSNCQDCSNPIYSGILNLFKMEERFPDNASQQAPTKAMRLIFEYEGDQVRLISQTPVDMALTGSDVAHAEHAAYFVDTRDAANQTLARVSAHGAFASSTEVFPEQHGAPITRVEISNPKGAFTVIAPAPEATHHVTVLKAAQVGSPVPGAARDLSTGVQETTEIASFPISFQDNPKKEGGTQ